MKKFYITLFSTVFLSLIGSAQSNVIVFSDGGEKFYAIINGKTYNEEPQSRVECKGLMGENQRIDIRFEDESLASIKKNFMVEAGLQYTVMIKKNKKGAYVMRPMDMGTPVVLSEEAPEPDYSSFEQAETIPTRSGTEPKIIAQKMGTSVTVTETSTTTTSGEQVKMDMDLGGVDFNMNVNVNDGVGTGTQTQTQTTMTTTTTTSGTAQTIDHHSTTNETVAVETEYILPGYSGETGCPYPMSQSEFNNARSSIASKSFADSKMTLAKQVGNSNCFLTEQVQSIMSEFDFEDDKLEFAKFAYERTYDIGNYYKVNDSFTFESSIEELNEYIQGR